MASMEVEAGSSSVHDGGSEQQQVAEIKNKDNGNINEKKKKKKKKKKKGSTSSYMPKFSCLRTEVDEKGNFDMEVETVDGERARPCHLVVMVNGIIGSAKNWRYAATQLISRYPEDLIVHCSKSNSSFLTFDGVDVMGNRLADEVISVIKHHPSVQKISFIGHSLGGLVSRYAIARLYGRDVTGELPQGNGECRNTGSGDACQQEKFIGKIAGLEPINFVTSATPHLGSRGHKQVPVFCGLYTLEKVAAHTSWFLGRTGKHLFLTDNNEGKPPLLLQMATDCEDLKFISALRSFRRCVAYANARFDHLVGWSTSSLRHPNELPKRQQLQRGDKYPHVVNVEIAKIASAQQEIHLETIINGYETADKEEKMLRALTAVGWERVDVDFSGSKQRFLAHNTIQVKTYCINSDGADVIQHMIDNFIP